MQRRQFLATTGAAMLLPACTQSRPTRTGPGYACPRAAMRGPREKLLYTVAFYDGTGIDEPGYLATIDADPASPTYSTVTHRLSMPNRGDELHHFGWNTCSSCHGDPTKTRRYLIVPGLASGRIHVVDTLDHAAPRLHKVIEAEEIAAKANLSAPHTVHCLADGTVMISMLGDGEGNAPGGFLLLDERFDVVGRWEVDATGMEYNYDYWYQPRHDVMVSTEWGAPKTYTPGFDPADVAAGKYGNKIHFWDWSSRRIAQTVVLGDTGWIPLEVRFHHDPDSPHGFVGAALSSTMWHFHKDGAGGNERWAADQVIAVEPVEVEGWPFPVPGLITDLVLSMDDRFLYFSNWLHGDLRQYDVSDPANPRLVGQVWLGGVIGNEAFIGDRKLRGGPQMLQLSLDGRRLYVTSSLHSAWDNQFYPDIARRGSFLLRIDCDTTDGGLAVDGSFHVDFGQEPHGPARAHEMRFPDGDCTSDIWT